MMPRRILCPIDFSPGSEHAQRIAIRLAHETNAPLALVHAWSVPAVATATDMPVASDSLQGLLDDAERGLTDALDEARRGGVTHIKAQLVSGPAAERILELAEPTDLIVMGTHGRTGLARLLLGSVAETVVRHARCSVLVARRHVASHFHHILVPVDFSDCSRRALDEAGELASRSGASVTLLHVLDPPEVYRQDQDEDLQSTGRLDDWGDLVEARTARQVTRLMRTGSPAPQVLSTVAEDPSVDLIVVGSHGRTGLQRMLIGSVAEKVMRHATRPVMIAR